MTANYYHMKNLLMLERKKLEKLDNEEYKKVPLPESFYNHIKNNQMTNPRVIQSENLLKIYKNLIL